MRILLVLVALLALTGCNAIKNATTSDAKKAAIGYMNSKERVARFEKLWPAATTVAKALLDGKLGKAQRLDSDFKPLKSGYTGWGSLKSGKEDHEHSAEVWWKADGTVDFGKGIPSFGVDGFYCQSKDEGNGAYVTHIPTKLSEGIARVVSAERIAGKQHPAGFVYPLTLDELREFDKGVSAALQRHMKVAGLG